MAYTGFTYTDPTPFCFIVTGNPEPFIVDDIEYSEATHGSVQSALAPFCLTTCSQCHEVKENQHFPNDKHDGKDICAVCCIKLEQAAKDKKRRQMVKAHHPEMHYAGKLLQSARHRAKQKGLVVSVTREWILERLLNGECEITGVKFDLSGEHKKGRTRSPWAPSLDRTNPTEGYTPENTKVVVWLYNAGKGESTPAEFEMLVLSMAAKFK